MRSTSARSATSIDRSRLLFVLPNIAGRSAAIESRLIAAAGLATAMGKKLGGVDMLTPMGLTHPDAVISHGVRETTSPSTPRAMARRLPSSLRSAVGDLRRRRLNQRMHVKGSEIAGGSYGLVLQLHHRFQDSGLEVARRAGAPFVLRIEALEAREEASWGVRRLGFQGAVERFGELPIVRRADLVASVSDVLDAQLADLGVPIDQRMVLPNGVDTSRFSPGPADVALRSAYGLDGRFTIGWVGGFRPFHGLELLPDIARRLRRRVPGAVLCLVGTGPLRQRLVDATRDVADVVRFLPPVVHDDVPRWLRSFDACLLLGEGHDFHYSPLKLYEYLACGRPVVATGVGQVDDVLGDLFRGWLVEPGDSDGIVERIHRLAQEPELRETIGSHGRELAVRSASWEVRAETLLDRLATAGLST